MLAVIIEPQGRADDDKAVSWPCYVTNARRANKCPASALIVLCWSTAQADKCRYPLPTGHPGFSLTPLIIDRRDAPDLDRAAPYLVLCFTILGAVDLNADKGRRQALDAIKSIQASGARRSDTEDLTRIIMGLASDSSRQRLAELIMAISYRSEFIDSWKDKGRAEGRAEGWAEGRAEGRTEGRTAGQAEVKARDILKVLDSRKIRLTKTSAR